MFRRNGAEGRLQVGAVHPQKGPDRGFGGCPAQALSQGLRHLRQAGLDPRRPVCQLEVGRRVVRVDPQKAVGQGREQSRPVLARRAVDQHRPARSEGLEIAGEELDMARLEGRAPVVVEEEGPGALGRQVGLAKEGHVRRLGLVSGVAVNHLAREAIRPPGGLVRPLRRPAQVDHGGEAQAGDPRQVGIRRRAVMGRAPQPPAHDTQSARDGVAAIVAEVLDALQGQQAFIRGHGRPSRSGV